MKKYKITLLLSLIVSHTYNFTSQGSSSSQTYNFNSSSQSTEPKPYTQVLDERAAAIFKPIGWPVDVDVDYTDFLVNPSGARINGLPYDSFLLEAQAGIYHEKDLNKIPEDDPDLQRYPELNTVYKVPEISAQPRPALEVFNTGSALGNEVLASENIQAGTWIRQYTGVMQKYPAKTNPTDKYPFNEKSNYAMQLLSNAAIDAEIVGNEAGRMNHSYVPNAQIVPVKRITGSVELWVRSVKDITAKTPVRINYGCGYWRALKKVPCDEPNVRTLHQDEHHTLYATQNPNHSVSVYGDNPTTGSVQIDNTKNCAMKYPTVHTQRSNDVSIITLLLSRLTEPATDRPQIDLKPFVVDNSKQVRIIRNITEQEHEEEFLNQNSSTMQTIQRILNPQICS